MQSFSSCQSNHIEDLYEAGGVTAVMNELSKKNLLSLDMYYGNRKNTRGKYRR